MIPFSRNLTISEKHKTQLQALEEIHRHIVDVDDIIDQLVMFGGLTSSEGTLIKQSTNRVENLYLAMIKNEKEGKILLIDFTWYLLPFRFIQLKIILESKVLEYTLN